MNIRWITSIIVLLIWRITAFRSIQRNMMRKSQCGSRKSSLIGLELSSGLCFSRRWRILLSGVWRVVRVMWWPRRVLLSWWVMISWLTRIWILGWLRLIWVRRWIILLLWLRSWWRWYCRIQLNCLRQVRRGKMWDLLLVFIKEIRICPTILFIICDFNNFYIYSIETNQLFSTMLLWDKIVAAK